jgi:anti-sigma regulatory factor (Ser/Thr protein kinase)
VAVEEAVTNVCRHAYREASGEVRLRLRRSAGALVVEVEDDGPSFDPLSHPEPDVNAPLAERSIGGLGILMIRKLVDEVSWRREDGRNVLTMTVRP